MKTTAISDAEKNNDRMEESMPETYKVESEELADLPTTFKCLICKPYPGRTSNFRNFSTKLRFLMKESTVRKFKKAWMEKNGVDIIDTTQQNNEQVLDLGATGEQSIPYDTINMADKIMEESQSVPLPLTVSREASIEGVNLSPVKLKRRKTGTKVTRDKKQLERRSKRGQYANYSPNLRAEIAKYAANHGNQQTIAYFREHFNLEVPASLAFQ